MYRVLGIRAITIVVFLLSQAASAGATLGGSEVAEILGWSPAEGRLYYIVHYADESGRLPSLYYLDLKSSDPDRPVPIMLWPRELGKGGENLYTSGLNQLKKRLAKLTIPVSDPLILTITTKSIKEQRHPYGVTVPKYELEVQITQNSLKGHALLTSYRNREILIKEWYRIPELPYAVVSLSYTGILDETCYDRPAVVLLKANTMGNLTSERQNAPHR